MKTYEIGFLISDICSLIPVFAGIYFFKRLKSHRRILLYLFIYNSAVELTNAWMAMHHRFNMWSINIYMFIEYSVFIFIFNQWVKDIFMRWLSLVGSVIFYALWAGYFILHKNINENNAPAAFTESIVLMLLSGFVITTLGLRTETPVFKNYRFWFAGAAFIYFAVNILLNYIFDLISSNTSNYDMSIWSIHTVINIAVYFVFAYAFTIQEE
jgi:hypothetical protein